LESGAVITSGQSFWLWRYLGLPFSSAIWLEFNYGLDWTLPKHKQPIGTPGKKPPAPSVKVRRRTAFDTLVEMMSRKSRADDAGEPTRSSPRKKRRRVG
jgi:hypothetical protein